VAKDLPRLSPDGKRLAYGVRKWVDRPVSSEVAAQVHVREVDNADSLRDLGVSGHEWCWSGDGTKLLVATVEPPQGGNQEFKHVIVDVETGQTSELKLPAGHLATDWSPDGNWFLTTSVAPKASQPTHAAPIVQVELVSRDGATVRRISTPGQPAVLGRFSPDGRLVLYTVPNHEDDTGSLYVAKLSGGEPKQITPGLNEEPMGACWSPDGQRIAYVWRMRHPNGQAEHETESSLAIVDLDGHHLGTLLTETALPREGVSNTQVILRLHSPDWR
jgi:Tol biopolymer transport system component